MAKQAAHTYQDIDFRMRPDDNGDIILLNDMDCIKQSIKNLIQLELLDLPFDDKHYAGINKFLFDQTGPITEGEIILRVKSVLGLEKRITLNTVEIDLQTDLKSYIVLIFFTVIATQQKDSVNIILKRER